jgi:hypothetical protein
MTPQSFVRRHTSDNNIISIIKLIFIRKKQSAGEVLNSPADPLPPPFYDAKFRCRQAPLNRAQRVDLLKILDTERALLGS